MTHQNEQDDGRWQTASALLQQAWRSGSTIPAIPEAERPASRADGYAVQALLERSSAAPLFGWKIAATSKAGQAHINVDGPLAGRLLLEKVVPLGTPVHLGSNRMRVAEIEFAYRMGRDLMPRAEAYSDAEVMAAVAGLHLAVEVPDSRYADFVRAGAAQLIADNACADQFVLGPEAAGWRALDLAALEVRGSVSGRLVHEGRGANVLGGPQIALAWLANELSQHGVPLRAGQVVTTGTCVIPLPVGPGDVVTGDYGPLGRIVVAFT